LSEVRFVLCIHNHQPTGNFDHVFEDAYQRAYRPFLDVMDRFPELPWVLHNSGCLWEWLERNHPEYIERIGRRVAAGRLELLGGGFFEPVLPALAPEDRRGQITRMRGYLKWRFGVTPRGIWLTERVWEPDLPIDLGAAGVEYLPIDDTQLLQVGVPAESVRGSFHTESAGSALRLFPALMSLRYRIPYANPEETVAFLRDPFPGHGAGLAVYADDGEKFGIWPGTHQLLYEERWLERFLEALQSASDGITLTTFAAEADRPSAGLVYLPTGSYAEMGQWALPPVAQGQWERARETLRAHGLAAEAELFVRGGFWRNFFARYPESHWMHMRALEGSRRCAAARASMPEAEWARARDHLWRAQCNCAYWHGVFGGLYLPHLRDGIYREIVAGETLLARAAHDGAPWAEAAALDLDRDGAPEWRLENDATVVFVAPAAGGRIVEWDDRAAALNLVNGMTRRREHYHEQVTNQPIPATAETIHGAIRSREEGLRELLGTDRWTRSALLDRIFATAPTAAALRADRAEEIADFPLRAFTAQPEASTARPALGLRAQAALRLPGEPVLEIEKTVALAPGMRGFDLTLRYANRSDLPLRAWAGLELLINLLAGHATNRFVLVGNELPPDAFLDGTADHETVRGIALVDEWRRIRVAFQLDRPLTILRYPLETVSLSEAGAERNFQGSVLVVVTPLDLTPGGEAGLKLTARVTEP